MDESVNVPILAYICENNIRECVMLTKNLPVYIRSLLLRNYKCFEGENIFWFCNDEKSTKLSQCTIILGDNGTGKTNILKAIANLEPVLEEVLNIEATADHIEGLFVDTAIAVGDKTISPDLSKKQMYKPRVIERYSCKEQYDIECDFLKMATTKGRIDRSSFNHLIRYTTKVPQSNNTIFISDSLTRLGYTQRTNYVDPTPDLKYVKIDAYGTNRHSKIGSKKIENQLNSESLFFEDNRLIDVESWIMQLDIAKNHKRPGASQKYKRVRNLIRHSLLFPDVRDLEIGFDENENSFVKFITNTGEHRLNDLGYGYQCMFSWIFDFCKKLFDRYPNSDNPFHEPAILLIDEIDMHLHPSWQRSILTELCNMFPNTQFIITTHSPLIIQSIENINLYVLSKDGDHTKITRCAEKTFLGWTVEEILSELMDLNENIRPQKYQQLREDFESAMNRGDLEKGKKAYDELKKIVHPQNVEGKLLDMDLGQLKAMQDD